MPSAALIHWAGVRAARLDDIHGQCLATSAAAPPNPDLADENLRGYVMLLSAHFQGFCRDLYSECVQTVTTIPAIPRLMQFMFQVQCMTSREIDGANPRYETLRKDYERFGIDLGAELATDPANANRIGDLHHMNLWRNYAAHHKNAAPAHGGPFVVATVRGWQDSCAGLAAELDRIMYDRIVVLTGLAPW